MSLRRVPRWPLLLVGLAGCGDATPAPTDAATVDVTAADSTLDAGPPPQCTAAIECDDGVACTVDQCVGGRCVHDPQQARCPDGSACDLVRGCLPRRPCRDTPDCADDDPCTLSERCDLVARFCVFDTLPTATLCGAPGSGRVCRGGACACPDDRPTVCGGACTDLQSDARNCGACGRSCGAGAWCRAGQCACSSPQTWCANVGCVDLSADSSHCGTCNLACGSGARCERGRCLSACAPGTHRCGDRCESDIAVATCGTRCEPCPAPANGVALCLGEGPTATCGRVCNPGFHPCGDRCLPNDDLASCGSRCAPCPAPPNGRVACVNQQCAVTCNTGYHACGELCLSDADVASCGTLCTPCPAPEYARAACVAGRCEFTCNPGFRMCNGLCTDGNDVRACGSACRACPVPGNGAATCTAGACGVTCDAGYHRCGEACVGDDSPEGCGGRCTPCPTPENGAPVCVGGACSVVCNPGFDRNQGRCVPRPRLLWPPSSSLLTGPRPMLRWTFPDDPPPTDGDVLELCTDRACSTVLTTLPAAARMGVPTRDLPRGRVFWRLRLGERTSATWSFYVSGRPGATMQPSLPWGVVPDFDADGYSELAVGSPFVNTPIGRAHVYRGGPTGPSQDRRWVLQASRSVAQFGGASTVGDFNGDGYPDLAMGAPLDFGDLGAVHIFYGRADGLGTGVAEQVLSGTDGPMPLFGAALSGAGDLNGDGYSDLVVGAPRALTAGRVYVYYGGAQGLGEMPSVVLSAPGLADARFGGAVAQVGDLDGDGDTDLLVGAENAVSFAGRAFVFLGDRAGVSRTPTLTLTYPAGGQFGASVTALGDANGDGYPDLAAGAPFALAGVGATLVFSGGPAVLANTAGVVVPGTGADTAGFGAAVSGVGDLDGDGFDDLAVGAPRSANFTGRVFVYPGAPGGPSTPRPPLQSSEGPGVYFGGALAGPRDLNGDGFFDLVASADRARSFEGIVYVYRGGASGLSAPSALASPEPSMARFGASLACR